MCRYCSCTSVDTLRTNTVVCVNRCCPLFGVQIPSQISSNLDLTTSPLVKVLLDLVIELEAKNRELGRQLENSTSVFPPPVDKYQ
jgi:hypothetical protein